MTQTRGDAGAAPHQRARALLEARSRALAQRGRATAQATATRSFLVCACGGDRFGLPLEQVAQVLPMRPVTPLPDAGPALLGLIALAGRVVGLLALGAALGRPGELLGAGAHVVVVRGGAAPVALAVDRVLGVAEIPDSALEGAESEAGLSAEAVSGYCPPGAGPGAESGFVAVDLPRLLRRYLS